MPNPFRLLALQWVCVFAFSGGLRGTSIAFLRTDQGIVIATDSRATDAKGNRKPDVCKIRNAGQMYFTMVGQIAWQGTDFEAIADRSIRSDRAVGYSSHVRPSSSRPFALGMRPPHCLKKKATPCALH